LISFISNSNDKLSVCKLIDLVNSLFSRNMKLVIALSTFIGIERAENSLDTYRSSKTIAKDEILFVPVRNSDFLSVNEDDDTFPANLLWCINKTCAELGLKVIKTYKEKAAFSRFFGECQVLVLSFTE
nr:hypothetical protein [Eubacterium sp.]